MHRFQMLSGLAIALVIFGIMAWGAPSGTETGLAKAASGENDTHPRQIYRAPLLNNPPTLDPAYVQDNYGITVIQQIFDGLVQFSSELFVIPALAENWQVEDGGRAYRFTLNEKARFHNGRRVTPKDVVFSLSRLLRVNPPPTILPHLLKITGAKDYREHKSETVPGLQPLDQRTLLIRLDEAYVPFITALGMYQAMIVPQDVVEADPQKFGTAPVGSGPFEFVSWEDSKSIRLKSYPDYYAGKPLLDGIEFVIYPGIGIEKVWTDFQGGKLDQMLVYGDIRERIQRSGDVRWVHRPSLSLLFYGFNSQNPVLKDPDLRMALSLAIDRDKLVDEVYGGRYEVARGILSPGLPGYHPSDRKTGADLAAAKEHLQRALGGKPLPGPIEIVSNSQSPLARAELELVRKSWAPLGIELETKFISDWSQFEQYLKSDSMQVYRYAWFADIPDPDDMLRPLFSSDSRLNYMHYENKDVDQMLQKALGIVDPVERAGMYQKIEEEILKSSPIVPLIHLGIDFVYQPTVQGIELSALGAHTISFHHVWLKDSPR